MWPSEVEPGGGGGAQLRRLCSFGLTLKLGGFGGAQLRICHCAASGDTPAQLARCPRIEAPRMTREEQRSLAEAEARSFGGVKKGL